MNAPLLAQWQRLIFPPEPLPVRAGEQLKTGNRYPDVPPGAIDWQAHQDGRKTYAVNPVYPGPDGGGLCQWGVLDIDEGGDSLNKARALLALCSVAGLSARAAWSGSKGCHVWLFCEPAPVALVRAVLAKLKAAVPFTGETIPGENQRAKLPPAFHQERRFWRALSLRLSPCWPITRTRAGNGGNRNRKPICNPTWGNWRARSPPAWRRWCNAGRNRPWVPGIRTP